MSSPWGLGPSQPGNPGSFRGPAPGPRCLVPAPGPASGPAERPDGEAVLGECPPRVGYAPAHPWPCDTRVAGPLGAWLLRAGPRPWPRSRAQGTRARVGCRPGARADQRRRRGWLGRRRLACVPPAWGTSPRSRYSRPRMGRSAPTVAAETPAGWLPGRITGPVVVVAAPVVVGPVVGRPGRGRPGRGRRGAGRGPGGGCNAGRGHQRGRRRYRAGWRGGGGPGRGRWRGHDGLGGGANGRGRRGWCPTADRGRRLGRSRSGGRGRSADGAPPRVRSGGWGRRGGRLPGSGGGGRCGCRGWLCWRRRLRDAGYPAWRFGLG